jgi:HEAT repeat protein
MASLLLSSCGKSQPILAGGKPLTYWVQNVSHPNKKVRKEAVAKLGNAGNLNPDVVPTLVSALGDVDAKVRCEAILALQKTGAASKQAAADLERLSQRDVDPKVREYASRALQKLH